MFYCVETPSVINCGHVSDSGDLRFRNNSSDACRLGVTSVVGAHVVAKSSPFHHLLFLPHGEPLT